MLTAPLPVHLVCLLTTSDNFVYWIVSHKTFNLIFFSLIYNGLFISSAHLSLYTVMFVILKDPQWMTPSGTTTAPSAGFPFGDP